MNKPSFLDLPFTKEKFNDRQLFDIMRKAKERNPAITDDEKVLLKQQYPNSHRGVNEKIGYTVYAARTEYRCKK